MLLLALSPAAWTQTEACAAYVADSLPRDGDLDVPVDVSPLVFIGSGACAPPDSYRLALLRVDVDGERVVADVEIDVEQPLAVLALSTWGQPPLEPDAEHVLRVSPRDGSAPVELSFRTGERSAFVAPVAAPVFTLSSATRGSTSTGELLSWAATFTGETDFEPLSAALVFDEEGRVVGGGRLDEATHSARLSGSVVMADAPRELCLSAAQVLVNGSQGPASALACGDVRRASGCATAPAPEGLALLGALALLRRAGRRRR